MAKALFNHFSTDGSAADSAGTQPGAHINPVVIKAMKEIGIDLSNEKPKMLTFDMAEEFDKAITMGCGVEETCPAAFIPSEDWGLDDPAGQPIEKVRQIRDEIASKVKALLTEP